MPKKCLGKKDVMSAMHMLAQEVRRVGAQGARAPMAPLELRGGPGNRSEEQKEREILQQKFLRKEILGLQAQISELRKSWKRPVQMWL